MPFIIDSSFPKFSYPAGFESFERQADQLTTNDVDQASIDKIRTSIVRMKEMYKRVFVNANKIKRWRSLPEKIKDDATRKDFLKTIDAFLEKQVKDGKTLTENEERLGRIFYAVMQQKDEAKAVKVASGTSVPFGPVV
jgi:hypothetical protein